jgi:hypothetical protein
LKKTQFNFNKFHSLLALPYLDTDQKLLPEIFRVLEDNFGLTRKSKQKIIDLGAGNGNVVIYSALNYQIESYGIELDENLIKEMKNKIKLMKKVTTYNKRLLKKIHIIPGDLFIHNLNPYNFIYLYSLPSIYKYLKHVLNTAKKGTIIISHKYPLNNFNSILEIKYNLLHKNKKQEIFTFFYKRS